MKVAVIGSGVSGLSAAWALCQSGEHEVHIFDEDKRAGGHAHTAELKRKGVEETARVDTAFMIVNEKAYPNFLRFLDLLDVDTVPSTSTVCVSKSSDKIEWSSETTSSFFARPGSLLDSRMWRMLYDIVRFNACSRSLLESTSNASIGEYLEANGYSDAFREYYLLPLASSIWAIPPKDCVSGFPIRILVRVLYNHHLLQMFGRAPWLTVKGGSKTYVEKVLDIIGRDHVHLSTKITKVTSLANKQVEVEGSDSGFIDTFDYVIMACHSDTTVDILKAGNITPDEQRILQRFTWAENDIVLHSDTTIMPEQPEAWAAWNFLLGSSEKSLGERDRCVSVTSWMNKLQDIPREEFGDVLVSMNPPIEPRPHYIAGRWKYNHVILTDSTVASQKEMPTIQNKRGIAFAGAWMRYGFHEDGFMSGIDAASYVLKDASPFTLTREERRVPHNATLIGAFDFLEASGVRALIGFIFTFVLELISIFIERYSFEAPAPVTPLIEKRAHKWSF